MTDAEKVREALDWEVVMDALSVHEDDARDTLQVLRNRYDSILTELAEAKEARDDARGVSRKLMKANSEWRVFTAAAEERAEKAEAALRSYRIVHARHYASLDEAEARIQELEAALAEANAVLLGEADAVEAATKASHITSRALAEDEA